MWPGSSVGRACITHVLRLSGLCSCCEFTSCLHAISFILSHCGSITRCLGWVMDQIKFRTFTQGPGWESRLRPEVDDELFRVQQVFFCHLPRAEVHLPKVSFHLPLCKLAYLLAVIKCQQRGPGETYRVKES